MTIVYIDPRKSSGIQVPIRVQVKMARDYCSEQNLDFALPITESFIDTESPILEEWICTSKEDIVVYSHMFFNRKKTVSTMQRVIKSQKAVGDRMVHITFSNRKLTMSDLLNEIESIMRFASYGMGIQRLLCYLDSEHRKND